MCIVIIAAVTALAVSVICCKIYSIYALKIIDKYVKDIIELAKQSIRNTYFDK